MQTIPSASWVIVLPAYAGMAGRLEALHGRYFHQQALSAKIHSVLYEHGATASVSVQLGRIHSSASEEGMRTAP